MRFEVRVPASTSNLGPGFDCLGMALEASLDVVVETGAGSALRIEVQGAERAGIPADATNLIYTALERVLSARGKPPPGLTLELRNGIPVGRGLGSSGAAIVAGVISGHLLCGDPEPRREEIASEAAAIEGHPDNVAAAVYGGLVAVARLDVGLQVVRLPLPDRLEVLLVIPEAQVPTQEARRVLPQRIQRADAVFNLSRLALLCGALAAGDLALLRTGMQDRLHQRQRLALLPGLARALDSLQAEPACLAAALSGSGPTLLGLYAALPADAGREAVDILLHYGHRSRRQRSRPQFQAATWRLLQSA